MPDTRCNSTVVQSLPASTRGFDSVAERLFNLLLAISVFSWGVFGLHRASIAEGLSIVQVCTALLHFAVASCLLIRSRVRKQGSINTILVSLPSFLFCGITFALSPPSTAWPLGAALIFVVGTLVAIWSAATLGRSFAVLPAVRSIIVTGPYRYVRHPMYVGELLLVAACVAAQPSTLACLAGGAIVPCVVMRILAEEGILRETTEYRKNCVNVRYRLIPGIW